MIDLSELDVILKKVNARKDNKPETKGEEESYAKNKSNIIDLSEHISASAESFKKESENGKSNQYSQQSNNEANSTNSTNNANDSIHKIDMESVRNAIKKAIESSSELQQKMKESSSANQSASNVNEDAINDGIHVLDDNIISDSENSANSPQAEEERAMEIEDFCTIDGTTAKTKEIQGFFSQKAEELSFKNEQQNNLTQEAKIEPQAQQTDDFDLETEREAKAQHKSNKAEVIDGEYDISTEISKEIPANKAYGENQIGINQQDIENAILGEEEASENEASPALNTQKIESINADKNIATNDDKNDCKNDGKNAAQKSHAITESKIHVSHSISGECIKVERGEDESTLFNQTIIAPESVVSEAKKTLMSDVSAALDTFMLKFEIKEDVQKFGRLKIKPTTQQTQAPALEAPKDEGAEQTTINEANETEEATKEAEVCKTEESCAMPETAIPQPKRMFVPDDANEYCNQSVSVCETQYENECSINSGINSGINGNANLNGYSDVDYSYQQSCGLTKVDENADEDAQNEDSSSATFSMPTFSVPSQYMSKPNQQQNNQNDEDEQASSMSGKFLQECFHCDDKNFAVCCISMHALREFCMSSGFFNDASLSVENVQSFLVAHVSQKCKRFSVDVDGGIQYAIVMKKEEKIKLGNHQVQMKEIHTCPECQSIVSQQLGINNFSFDQILTKRIKF